DGGRVDVEIAITPVESDDAALFVALVRDITERKAGERLLRESEARWRTIVNRAPVMIWTIDTGGVFTMAEGRVLELLGMTSQDLIGRSIDEVYSRMPAVLLHYQSALAGEAVE